MTTPSIDKLLDAILRFHGCEARHVKTVTVEDTYHGDVVWKGGVEVFELPHGGPRQCFAWAHPYGDHDELTRYFIVLEAPGIHTPLQAVRSSMANDYRRTDSSPTTLGA
jgi:hypothetical protein